MEEANDIGTALLRADLYPEGERAAFRQDFKDYLELRIAYFEERTMAKVLAADSMAQVIAAKLWQRATHLAKDLAYLAATQQMIPALNAMIDVATTRKAGELAKVPELLFGCFSDWPSHVVFLWGTLQHGKPNWTGLLPEDSACWFPSSYILRWIWIGPAGAS